MVTLRDVAEVVGVSMATASAVLNRTRSGTRVSEQTRAALVEAASRMGYQPNEVARSLTRRKTQLIGLYTHFEFLSAWNGFLSDLVGGIQQEASRRNYDVLLRTVPLDAAPEKILGQLADRRVDGLLHFAPEDRDLIPGLSKKGVPVVCLVDASDGNPSVVADDFGGGRMLAKYLHEQGHRRVIYRYWYKPPVSAQRRRAGFLQAADELGLVVEDGLVIARHREAHLSESELRMLREPRRATAIVCWDDPSAADTCDALASLGFDIPGVVAVTGFNGTIYGVPPRWPLTTVSAAWTEVGARGVERLLQLIDGQDIPAEDVLPVQLVIGKTA